jgi:hypothetical protein
MRDLVREFFDLMGQVMGRLTLYMQTMVGEDFINRLVLSGNGRR